MGVQVPVWVLSAVYGSLVETHRIGERDLEQVIVAGGELFEDVGQATSLRLLKIRERTHLAPADDKRLEGPHRPERHQGYEVLVLGHYPLARFQFQCEIVRQQ